MRNAKNLVFIVLMFALVLAGCGGGSGTASNETSGSGETTNTPAQSADSNTSEPQTRTIKHVLGETEITGVPQRVVALEWLYAEDVMALGV